MRKAFTLIEVNLAMLIMAGGVLSILGLYSFGFKENAQSETDVQSAALAEAILSPLIAAASATNVTWASFNQGGAYRFPDDDGWASYAGGSDFSVSSDPMGSAQDAINAFLGKLGSGSDTIPSGYPENIACGNLTYAIVITHEDGSGVISLAFRAVPKSQYATLMSQPLYYTEVRFQGQGELK